jgi:hypothetical protein
MAPAFRAATKNDLSSPDPPAPVADLRKASIRSNLESDSSGDHTRAETREPQAQASWIAESHGRTASSPLEFQLVTADVPKAVDVYGSKAQGIALPSYGFDQPVQVEHLVQELRKPFAPGFDWILVGDHQHHLVDDLARLDRKRPEQIPFPRMLIPSFLGHNVPLPVDGAGGTIN